MAAIPKTQNLIDYLSYLIANGLPSAASPMPTPPVTQNPVDYLRYICENGLTGGGGGSVNTSGNNTWTGTNGFSSQLYRNATTMSGTSIDITKAALNRSLTGNESETFSATPSTDLTLPVFYTADGTARTVTFGTTVYSYARQGDISSTGFVIPASGTYEVLFNYSLARARWEVAGDPISISAVVLTEAAGATTINCALGSCFSLTLNANLTTVTLSNFADGQVINVAITNTGSNFTVTWGNSIKWVAATQPTQTVGAKTDVWTLMKVGSTIYGNAVQNLS